VSADDVRLVREWFLGFERAELGLEICDPAIEIRNWAEFPITGPYRGHDGVRGWWNDIDEAFEGLSWELLDLIDVGDGRVVTVQRFTGRFRLTGIETSFAWGAVITVKEGKIAAAMGYPSPRQAKEAAGLESSRAED
jgi:ketosteroid isomerase-like protein